MRNDLLCRGFHFGFPESVFPSAHESSIPTHLVGHMVLFWNNFHLIFLHSLEVFLLFFTLSKSADVLEDGSFVQMLFLLMICDNYKTLIRIICILERNRKYSPIGDA